jgi:hypothetical protein
LVMPDTRAVDEASMRFCFKVRSAFDRFNILFVVTAKLEKYRLPAGNTYCTIIC